MKEDLGLFEAPYPDPVEQSRIATGLARTVAREAARESIVLLKNDNNVLPLRPNVRVLVTGPAAASRSALFGGWSYTWQGADTTWFPRGAPSLLDALRKRVPALRYVKGASFTATEDVNAAVQAARESDLAIVVLGEEGYAEWIGDVVDLRLPSAQRELASAVQATGIPTVVVLLEGRPRIVADIADSARGIVLGLWPGIEGAEAVAEVLFGETNPGGRLPFTYPRDVNALGTYDHKFTESLGPGYDRAPGGGFVPQFSFGHGLSYTTFAYSNLRVAKDRLAIGESQNLSVTVMNTGTREGDESVLLFTRQQYSSTTPSVRRLRGVEKVRLAPGETRDVVFVLGPDELSIVRQDGSNAQEAGLVDVTIGSLKGTFEVRRNSSTKVTSGR
jgi:beta-glucosidase